MGISHLALDGGLQGAGENQVELLPERVGPCPVCELEDCVCDAGVDVDRSNPTDHLEGLAVGLGPDQPDIARIQICGSLWTLAAQYSTDARSLWTNRKFREALVNAALVEQPLAVRTRAAAEVYMRRVRFGLMTSCKLSVPPNEGLESTSSWPTSAESAPPRVHLSAGLRTAALGALWSFALVEETKELMWKDVGAAVGPVRSRKLGAAFQCEGLGAQFHCLC